jgi:hypothetical protein
MTDILMSLWTWLNSAVPLWCTAFAAFVGVTISEYWTRSGFIQDCACHFYRGATTDQGSPRWLTKPLATVRMHL